ncbi:MAG: protein kinase domain-containing protein [Pseudonocardiaceae bacterium]
MVLWSVPGVLNLRELREDPVGRRVLARHRITRKSLAVTYLSPELLADSEFRTRFARDSVRLARVREARVARVHRYCECHHGAAVVGDHVSGTSLRSLLLAQGAVGTEAALVVLKDSLRALAACHEVGLAHGDIKPEGVILTSAGRVRLVDFGLWTSDSRRLLDRSTPFYLAPEQRSGPLATPAGDVYAATVSFFECLAGAPPFYADGAAELAAKHEQSALPVDVVPEPVRELVLRGLAKDPRSRPEARSLLAQVGEVAARAAGSDWERSGRRELEALLAGRSTLPDVSAPVHRRGGADWQHRKPVRLAAVMGGALALAAGLASPPLAVILPGGSIFGSGGRSPVLAFPEPDRDAVPVRVVTNGQLADRALTPAATAETAGPLGSERPPARSISMPHIQAGPNARVTPDALPQGSTHPGSAAQSRSTSGQSTPAPPACAQGLMSAGEPCTAVNPERPTPGSAESASDPAQVAIPVSNPVQPSVPVEVPVQLPAPVVVPVQVLQSISIGQDIHPGQDSQGWAKKEQTGWQDTTSKTGEPTNGAQGNSTQGNLAQGNLAQGGFGSSGHDSRGTGQIFGHSGNTGQ